MPATRKVSREAQNQDLEQMKGLFGSPSPVVKHENPIETVQPIVETPVVEDEKVTPKPVEQIQTVALNTETADSSKTTPGARPGTTSSPTPWWCGPRGRARCPAAAKGPSFGRPSETKGGQAGLGWPKRSACPRGLAPGPPASRRCGCARPGWGSPPPGPGSAPGPTRPGSP